MRIVIDNLEYQLKDVMDRIHKESETKIKYKEGIDQCDSTIKLLRTQADSMLSAIDILKRSMYEGSD